MFNFFNTGKRTLPQQVQKNKEDIEQLQSIVKEAYNTQKVLTTEDSTIAVADTNIPAGVQTGYLMTAQGLLFKILKVYQDTAYLYYYATLPSGPANTLSIGSVVKGTEASATITGDAPNQTLNLVLPKGDTGAQGPQGIQGVTGPANTLNIGSVVKGTEASATITGDAPNQTLNLVLPKGDTGAQGPQGIQGIQGVQGVGISKIESNGYTDGDGFTLTHIDATLSNGNVEHFDVQAKQGAIGPQGEVGPQGPQGINGNSFVISGSVSAVSELPTANESLAGVAYYVGATAPRDVYTCVLSNSVYIWQNQGTLQGPPPQLIDINFYKDDSNMGWQKANEITQDQLKLLMNNALIRYNIPDSLEENATSSIIMPQPANISLYTYPDGTFETSRVSEITSEYGGYKIKSLVSGNNETAIIQTTTMVTMLELSSNATNGTLTDKELFSINNNPELIIIRNKERYILMDDQFESGYKVYTHIGHDSTNKYYVKCITITLSTKSWVFNSKEI